MTTNDYFKTFLVDTPTGLCYYLDSMGNRQLGNVSDGNHYELPETPDGWMDMELSFGRNAHYWGINRSFSIPLKFIGDGATIIRQLLYQGDGIETPVSLIILKWDDTIGYHRLYYRGQLDMTKVVDDVAESVTVNIMEGGVLQLLKAYENTVIEIPCDGSIPENIKILGDGIEFDDVFNYKILSVASPFPGPQPLPCVYVSNTGNNVGVQHGDQQMESFYLNYFQRSSNYVFSSVAPTRVRIQGSISVRTDFRLASTNFYMYTATSLTQPRGVGGQDHSHGLVTPFFDPSVDPSGIWDSTKSDTVIVGTNQQRTYNFDQTIDLVANENLFILFFNQNSSEPLSILGGSFTISFSSRQIATRIWAITAADTFKLLGQEIMSLAATTNQKFSYLFTSGLLQKYLNYVLTSGDAIRASADPNYYQYFNQTTLNPANPNNQFYNQFNSIGATIKTCLSDFFDSINAVRNAALGNQKDANGNDSLFLEAKDYVFDSSEVTFALPDVAKLRISLALDYYFNWLEVGSNPNNYDEQSGKYEYNSLNQFQAPIKSLAKILQLLCKYRLDSYGFVFTQFNTQGGKSTTYNQSDNSIWLVDIDFSKFIMDYYQASFISNITNTSSPVNTNIKLQPNYNYQPIVFGTIDGEYFINNIDFSIFMLNQNSVVGTTYAVQVILAALLNGLIGDSATIKMYINGVVVQQWTAAIVGVDTPLTANVTFNHVFNKGDNIYFTIDTIKTCTVSINNLSLNVGAGYFIAQTAGPILISAGSSQQLISLPLITPTFVNILGVNIPVVSSGFQYFRFLSTTQSRNFDWSVILDGFAQGNPGETMTLDFWKNGVKIGEVIYNAAALQYEFNPTGAVNFSGNVDLNLYDTYWFTGSASNMNAWISRAVIRFQSTQIKAYNFNRVKYDSMSGLPHPETAFNVELSPKRMLINNGSLLRSVLFNFGNRLMTFQTADKNEFLSTTLNGVTISENAAVNIGDLDAPLFYPFIAEFETQVPFTFDDLMSYAANGHISLPWKGKTIYIFPLQVTSKVALKDSQTWRGLISTKTNLADLVDLDWDGLTTLQLMDTSIPIISPLHWVPLDFVKDPRYNTFSMDEDWYVNRVKDYIDKQNYYAPWQTNDSIPLQCQTAGLDPVVIQAYTDKAIPFGSQIDFNSVSDPAVIAPQDLYEQIISLNSFPEGKYYFIWTMGTGEATAQWISEGIDVKVFQPKTQLYEYYNTRNRLGVIFTSGYRPCVRMFSAITRYSPESKFTTFVDQPQDIRLGNAISYDTWTLEMAFSSGMPDYMMRKMARIFDLDTVFIDGNQYSKDENAKIEKQNFPGQAKEYLKLAIRKFNNSDFVTQNTAGQLLPAGGGYTLDAAAFGQNSSPQKLVQIGNS